MNDVRINLKWIENMEKIRDKWNTSYFDMFHYGELFMPLEMGFIYWQLGKPDGQLPYSDRINDFPTEK